MSLYRFSHATTGLAILATSCTCDWSPLRCIVNVSLYQHRLGGILHRKKSTHFFHPYCNLFYNVLYTELNYCAFKLMHFIICELLGIPEILYQVLLRICTKTTAHYAKKYPLKCFIVFLSYYSLETLLAKSPGCSSFLFA